MSLKILNNEKSINIAKLKKLNNDIKNTNLIKLSQNNSKKTSLKGKKKLKSLIIDNKFCLRNNNLLKNKTKIKVLKTNPNDISKEKINLKEKNIIYLNTKDKKYNITKIKKDCNKKKKINLVTNNINNYYNNIYTEDISKTEDVDTETYDNNSFENHFNIYNNIYNGKKHNYFGICEDERYFTEEKFHDLEKNINNISKSNLSKTLKFKDIKKKCKKYLLSYNCNLTKYNIKIINDLIMEKNKHIVSLFKNYLLWDEPSEYLKRYYFIYESRYRIRPIASYYIAFTYFSPVYFCNLEIIKILLKNVKRKRNYFKEIENYEDNSSDDNENNTISSCFENNTENDSIYISNYKDNKKINNEFVPLIDSNEINKESQISSIKQKSLSLSMTLNNCNDLIEGNKKKQTIICNENKNTESNFDSNKDNFFNISITPIKKISDIVKEFNGYQNINNNNNQDKNELINKKSNKNKKKINIKNDINEFSNYEQKSKNKISENYNKNKEEGKKLNIILNKNKFEEIQKNLKDKKLKSYKTINNININPNHKEINLNKKQKSKKEEKKEIKYKKLKIINKHITNFISNINLNNFENKSLNTFHKKNIFKKIQINKEPKKISSIICLTQRNENNKLFNIINKDYSLILQNKNIHLNNTIYNRTSNIKIKKNFHNNIFKINNKYSKKSQFPKLLTSTDRTNIFTSKKRVEFPFRFHSLSSNKNRLLKIPDILNSKDNLKNNININSNRKKNNENSLLKKIQRTIRNTSKKHKKGKSENYSYLKRNNLTLNSKILININKNILLDLKKIGILDNAKKIYPISLKNKNCIKNIIDNFRCNNKDIFNSKSKNSTNNTLKNIKKSVNINKLTVNKVRRKYKSKSPTITNIKKKNKIINKTKTNLNFLKSIFGFSNNKILNETNNNTNINTINNINCINENDLKNKEHCSKIIKKYKKKINDEDNTFNFKEYVKSNHLRMISINKINLSLNLNTQRNLSKNDNFFNLINNDINNNFNKYFIKNDYIKPSKILQIEEKKKINKNINSKDKLKLKIKVNINNKNEGKLNKINADKTKNYKKFSTQLNNDKNIINKNIIKNNLNKRKSLNQKNLMLSTNISGKLSKNNIIKNFKKNFNSLINDDYSDYLTERKYLNKEPNITNTNSNNNLNSYSKDKPIKKNSYLIHPNKNICSLKNKILMSKNIIDKTQCKRNIEDKSINFIKIYKNTVSKNSLRKKSLTNISSFFHDIHLKKNSNDYFNRNIFKINNKNNTSNENSIKKYCKSNYNEFILNNPTNIQL